MVDPLNSVQPSVDSLFRFTTSLNHSFLITAEKKKYIYNIYIVITDLCSKAFKLLHLLCRMYYRKVWVMKLCTGIGRSFEVSHTKSMFVW